MDTAPERRARDKHLVAARVSCAILRRERFITGTKRTIETEPGWQAQRILRAPGRGLGRARQRAEHEQDQICFYFHNLIGRRLIPRATPQCKQYRNPIKHAVTYIY